MIYGVALLAACMFFGSFTGELLGLLTGIDKDIGGVGFAMVLLIPATNSKKSYLNYHRGTKKVLISGRRCTYLLLLPCRHLKML